MAVIRYEALPELEPPAVYYQRSLQVFDEYCSEDISGSGFSKMTIRSLQMFAVDAGLVPHFLSKQGDPR